MAGDRSPRPFLALILGAPVGAIGGLLGLGGAEFRLPLLKAFFERDPHRIVALNLAVSLFTLAASLAIRSFTAAIPDLENWILPVACLAAGATASAWIAAGRLKKIAAHRMEQTIAMLLVVIGLLLIAEAFVQLTPAALVTGTARVPVALAIGIGVGIVSSLLGVAGGEILVPVFVLVFGAGVKAAGTLSILVSLPTVSAGILRHARASAYRRADLRSLVFPMGLGSVAGAVVGGLLVPYASPTLLKIVLGILLVVSALKAFGGR